MIQVPEWTRPHICTSYPPSNHLPFEEWLTQQTLPELEREFIPIHLTSYWVNNGYGNDLQAKQRMQEFFDGLDRSKKYWVVIQYDDQFVIDIKDLDIVTFGMSYRLPKQKPTYVIPLIGQMGQHYEMSRRFTANFIGNKTHTIRDKMLEAIKHNTDYYVSLNAHSHEDYNSIMAQSVFSLCPIGYGKTSFRQYEAIYQESIPVVIFEDEVMEPYGIDINEYGVKIHESSIELISEILESVSPWAIDNKRKRMNELYRDLCTYEGVYDYIIKTLQNEV